MAYQSAVEFAGNRRIHMGLAVTDLEQSKQFYRLLLGEEPTKERPGYVKFEPADPSVNLTLNEVRSGQTPTSGATHYGIQVKSTQAVQDAIQRFKAAGQVTAVQEQATCCYAVQDKVWVTDPEGNQWEVFVVLEADAKQRQDADSTCCATEPTQAGVGAACCSG